MSSNQALLIVGHGSKSAEAIHEFGQIIDEIRKRSVFTLVKGAHMELAQPDIPTGIREIAEAGVKNITVVPYFLFMGNHIKYDIPEILDEQRKLYPDVTIRFAKPLGFDPIIADIIIKRANELE
jgi:sirohydrochlorin ferrochelatase